MVMEPSKYKDVATENWFPKRASIRKKVWKGEKSTAILQPQLYRISQLKASEVRKTFIK